MATKRLIKTISGYMKVKLAALTAPMANAYANAVVFSKIENLVATFCHRKSTKTSSRFLPVNTKGNNKSYQNPETQQNDYTARSLRSDRARTLLGRYLVTEHTPAARSLRNDRARTRLGRYEATEPAHAARSLHSDRARTLLSRYVATEHAHTARSLSSDRARTPLGRYDSSWLASTRYIATCQTVSRPVRPPRGSALRSPLNLHRNAFRFVSIGVSVEILRRKQVGLVSAPFHSL
ncbi:hypothetical protein F2Q69_00011697 [Brassica cretica]|uniref:Uncharacterized protein n=1 Tax=Brassica cretica TaxID=69181 RepID=A0A8S9R7N8_BRACR|nr:hypothetical protein F2Q69_00011697 [Brassica cretica]